MFASQMHAQNTANMQVPCFPIQVDKPTQMTRNLGYLLAKSLFVKETAGRDMVRHADYFCTHQLPMIVRQGKIEVVNLSTTTNQVSSTNVYVKIEFVRCWVSPPFVPDANNNRLKVTLEECQALLAAWGSCPQ